MSKLSKFQLPSFSNLAILALQRFTTKTISQVIIVLFFKSSGYTGSVKPMNGFHHTDPYPDPDPYEDDEDSSP